MNSRFLTLSIALFVAQMGHSQYTDMINSNRPGESQSAFSVGKSVVQLETGINGFQEKHDLLYTESQGFFSDVNLRWGMVLEELELNVKLQHQTDNYTTYLGTESRNGIKKASVGMKYLIYDPFKGYEDKPNVYSWKANHRFKWRQLRPAVSIYAGANLVPDNIYNTQNFPAITPKIALITQNQFEGGYVFVLNLISDHFNTDTPSWTYIATLTKGFSERWSGFIENQGIKSDYYSDAILRGGAAYLINSDLQLDASISTNFKSTPSILYGGMGLSWRFDGLYKPVELKKGKGKDSKKYKSK